MTSTATRSESFVRLKKEINMCMATSNQPHANYNSPSSPPRCHCSRQEEATPGDGAEKEGPVAISDVTRLSPPSPYVPHRPRAPYGCDSPRAALQQRDKGITEPLHPRAVPTCRKTSRRSENGVRDPCWASACVANSPSDVQVLKHTKC